MFRAVYVKHDVTAYLDICTQSRYALYGGTMSSGVMGAQLMTIKSPSLILPGADASHVTSVALAMKELMPAE